MSFQTQQQPQPGGDIYQIAADQSNTTLYDVAIPDMIDPMFIKKIIRKRWTKSFLGILLISFVLLIIMSLLVSIIYMSQESQWNGVSIGSTIAVIFVFVSGIILGSWAYNQYTIKDARTQLKRCSITSATGWAQCIRLVFDI